MSLAIIATAAATIKTVELKSLATANFNLQHNQSRLLIHHRQLGHHHCRISPDPESADLGMDGTAHCRELRCCRAQWWR